MVEKNQRRWDGSLGSGEAGLKRCDFRCRLNADRVKQEWTLAGRLFKMVGAATGPSHNESEKDRVMLKTIQKVPGTKIQ